MQSKKMETESEQRSKQNVFHSQICGQNAALANTQQKLWHLHQLHLCTLNVLWMKLSTDGHALQASHGSHTRNSGEQVTQIMERNLSVQREAILVLSTLLTVVPATCLTGGSGPHTALVQSERGEGKQWCSSCLPHAACRLTTDRKKNNEAQVMIRVKVWTRHCSCRSWQVASTTLFKSSSTGTSVLFWWSSCSVSRFEGAVYLQEKVFVTFAKTVTIYNTI